MSTSPVSELSEKEKLAKEKTDETKKQNSLNPEKETVSLSESVCIALTQYFDDLDEETTCNLYELVLKEVEAPMLKVVMEKTANNQSQASEILGLNRGTLRKKLKQYNLI